MKSDQMLLQKNAEAFIDHKWIVFVAAFTVAFLNYGIIATMGALYLGMLDTYHAGRAETALVQSLAITFSLGFGVISGFLVARFGVRVVTSCAALMTALGFTLSFFSTTIYELYGYISIIAGLGFSTMYVSGVLSVGRVFVSRQKSIALSLQSGGAALSGFMWPNVLTALFDTYSLRGTFLIIGGMFLNNMVFAIIFANCDTDKRNVETKTIEEHGKAYIMTDSPINVTEVDNKSVLDQDVCISNDLQEVVNEHTAHANAESKDGRRNNKEHVDGILKAANGNTDKHCHFTDNIDKEAMSDDHDNKKEQVHDSRDGRVRNRLNVFNGYNNEAVDVINNNKGSKDILKSSNECNRRDIDEKTKQKAIKNKRTERRNTMPEKSSRKILLPIFVVAGTLNISMLYGFLTVYQDINIFNGLTTEQSELTFMSYALLNVLSRLLPIIPAKIDCISSFTVPVVTSLCGAIGQIIFLTTSSLAGSIVAMTFAGVADGGWSASMIAVVFELLPEEKQAVGFGFVLTLFGIVSGATGPVFGSLRDYSSSYQTVLIITTSMFLTSALLEFVCLVISKKSSKK